MAKLLTYLLLIIFSTSAVVCQMLHLKSSCLRDDPELSVCIKRTMMKWKPFLAEGMPDYKVPKMEPLFISRMFENEPVGPNKGVFMSATNLNIYGTTKYIVRTVDVSVDDGILHYEAFFPSIYVDGLYSTHGTYYIPITGSGRVTANYSNCVGKVNIEWDVVTRRNKEYIKVTKVDGIIEVGTATNVFLENFITSDPGLSGFINVAINAMISNSAGFWNLVSNDVIKAVERKLSPMMLSVLNDVTRRIPFEDILLVI